MITLHTCYLYICNNNNDDDDDDDDDENNFLYFLEY